MRRKEYTLYEEHTVRNTNFETHGRRRTEGIRPFPESYAYELSPGERSELAFILQLMLNSLSLYYDLPRIPVNGTYDTVTELVVREFQRVNMLPVTGRVDRATWKRLAEEYNETVNNKQ